MASIQDSPNQQPPPQPHQQQPRLSLRVDTPIGSSPFPSPSSSFLPPPMPGAHEFAVKAPPPGKGKRASKADIALAPGTTTNVGNGNGSGNGLVEGNEKGRELKENGLSSRADFGDLRTSSPVTPTPANKSTFLVPATSASVSASASTSTLTPESELVSPTSPGNTPTGFPTPTTPHSSSLSSILISSSSSSSPAKPSRDSVLSSPTRTSNPIRSSTRDSTIQNSSVSNNNSSHPDSTPSPPQLPLTSTRPAPPSPAISRRASGAPSTTSTRSRSSRPSSQIHSQGPGMLSRNPSTRKSTQLSQSMSPQLLQQLQLQQQLQQQKKRRSLLVKIKDFAFASTDDRHAGLGADVPKPNRVRVLNRFHRSRSASNASHLSVSSTGTESSGAGGDEEDDDAGMGEDGWGGFKWGFGRFSSWGFGRGASAGAGVVGTSGGGRNSAGEPASPTSNFPSKTDFARNFGEEPDTYDDDDDDDDYDDAEEGDEYYQGASPSDEEPLYPGLYRALYAFEPEGTAEMKLEEDQVVRVIGRGGGVGWAVVDRDTGGGGHALVPESYLEVVRLDGEEEGGEGA